MATSRASRVADNANKLADRLRFVMEHHATDVMKRPDVSGVGVAWREGALRFVVQTDSTNEVEGLKRELPAQVEGFPLRVEVEALARAAAMDGGVDERPCLERRGSALRRLARLFSPGGRWLRLVRKERRTA